MPSGDCECSSRRRAAARAFTAGGAGEDRVSIPRAAGRCWRWHLRMVPPRRAGKPSSMPHGPCCAATESCAAASCSGRAACRVGAICWVFSGGSRRAGRFAAGDSSVHWAASSLRSQARWRCSVGADGDARADEWIVVSAADPLNLAGILTPRRPGGGRPQSSSALPGRCCRGDPHRRGITVARTARWRRATSGGDGTPRPRGCTDSRARRFGHFAADGADAGQVGGFQKGVRLCDEF